MARKARQLGLISLEELLEVETDPLINKGLELLVIGVAVTQESLTLSS